MAEIDKYINQIICGDALETLKLLPDSSIDEVVTSPPYWGLRDYQVDGQLGLEQTFDEYIFKLCNIFDEVKRVLKPTGTLFVNLGDTYGGSGNGSWNAPVEKRGKQYRKTINIDQEYLAPPRKSSQNLAKSLCLIPFRFAIEMQNRGWIIRNVIIWHKPNAMPQSVKDRFTVDFEYIFFFVKSKRYYFEQQFESLVYFDKRGNQRIEYNGKLSKAKKNNIKGIQTAYMGQNQELGKNKRCVWSIPTKPFDEAHFATYPEDLVKPMILAGCPEYVCTKCGKPREKIYARELVKSGKPSDRKVAIINNVSDTSCFRTNDEYTFVENGYTDCGCNAEFTKGIVLDPFGGAMTTAVVAKKLNRNWIMIEINPEYIEIGKKRLSQIPDTLFTIPPQEE